MKGQTMNRTTLLPLTVIMLLLSLTVFASAEPIESEYLPGEILLKFHQQIMPEIAANQIATGVASIDAIFEDAPLISLNRALPAVESGNAYGLDRVWSLKFDVSTDLLPLLDALCADPSVEYAEPRYVRYLDRIGTAEVYPRTDGGDEIPNDPYYSSQWALPRIQAAQAWDVTHGSPTIPVAIVDSGTDLDHPDLAANIWQNDVELSGTPGVDDDGNGFVDDFYGWDFMDSDGYPNPSPGASHGTHTSGSASAVTNNGVGVAGVGWSCKIMAVRTGDGIYIYYGIEGINYAALTGARVISCSWGGGGGSQYEQDVINNATALGALVVAAAGNESSSAPHYPAAYDNVTAVAATNTGDVRSTYSNYGTWVDCTAPGDFIYSTVIGGYGYMSGTSMSCPHVAGLAGLVTSMHPEWTPDRVEAQILSTCDNIDAVNPAFVGLLGAGRINAYRAVTESNPYLVISDDGFSDEDGDGIIEPGEWVEFWVEITNLLEPLNNVQGTVSTTDPYVTLNQSQASYGNLATGASASNQATPFAFDVSPDAPGSHQITFNLQLTGDGGYSSTEYVSFTILPIYGDHDVGNVVLTVTNFGSLGFYDYAVSGSNIGSGFQYPAGTTSALFHGSLMVGVSTSMVSDNSYGNSSYDNYDFRNVPGGELSISPGSIADQEGMTIFEDSRSSIPIGVQVTQLSYAWANPPDDDFVMLRYDVTNTTSSTLNNLYVAVYLDWDVGDYSNNQAGWDPDSAVGWMKDASSPYYGLCLVSHDPASYRAVQNSTYVYNNLFTDALKYQFMTEGFVVTQSSSPDDWSMQLSAGPFQIAPGATEIVGFAMLGGDNLSDLRFNVGQARLRWGDIILDVPPGAETSQPFTLRLYEPYPNPFNPTTRIDFALPQAGYATLKAFDATGREVATLINGWTSAGQHSIPFIAGDLGSGVYFLRLQTGDTVEMRKVVLLK